MKFSFTVTFFSKLDDQVNSIAAVDCIPLTTYLPLFSMEIEGIYTTLI